MLDTIHRDGAKFSVVILFITQEYPKVTTSQIANYNRCALSYDIETITRAVLFSMMRYILC